MKHNQVRKKDVECKHKGKIQLHPKVEWAMGERWMDGWMNGIHHSIEDGVFWLQDQTLLF
jgi:hypothetical protein